MGDDQWNWEDQGWQDLSFPERVDFNPLAELGIEIALSILAIEANLGSFCSACTCIGYHIPCSKGECELCGCDEIHLICITCSNSRSIELYEAGSKACKYCIASPPIRIRPMSYPEYREREIPAHKEAAFNRNKEAWILLKEWME